MCWHDSTLRAIRPSTRPEAFRELVRPECTSERNATAAIRVRAREADNRCDDRHMGQCLPEANIEL